MPHFGLVGVIIRLILSFRGFTLINKEYYVEFLLIYSKHTTTFFYERNLTPPPHSQSSVRPLPEVAHQSEYSLGSCPKRSPYPHIKVCVEAEASPG